jgi:hypothetical protein
MPRSFTPLPWKKGFRKLPPNVSAVLSNASDQAKFVVCGEKVISEADLKGQVYRHLDIESAQDLTQQFSPFIPSPTVGATSFKNATPIEEVQKHLGLIWKTYSGRAPSRGRFKSHPTRFRRKVRPRRLIPPSMSSLAFKRMGEIPGRGISVLFQIMEVLDRSDEKGILRCLNLLQENVGIAELRSVETAEAEAVRNLNLAVGWEILPDNAPNATLDRVYRRLGGRETKAARQVQDRLGVLRALNPTRTFVSNRGLVGYIAMDFCPTLTVFEHLEIDHAMFIAHGPVEEFIGLTRPQLIAKLGSGVVERFEHRSGWQDRLRRMVKIERGDQSAHPGDII